MPLLSYPLPRVFPVTSGLGEPRPYGGHEGIDIGAPTGTPILAAGNGVVSQVGYMPDGYGYYVEIDHGDGVRTLYGHMQGMPRVLKGAVVKAGDMLGLVGETGYATGPHLHFHIKINGRYVDPLQYISDTAARISDTIRDAARTLYRQHGKCFDVIVAGGSVEDFEQCVKTEENRELTPEERMVAQELVREAGEGFDVVDALWPDKLNVGDKIDKAIETIIDFVLDIVLLPARLTINIFELSDAPLTDGRETYEWLNESDNAEILAIAIVLVIFMLVLIAIAVRALLQEQMQNQIANIIDNPAQSAIRAVNNEA